MAGNGRTAIIYGDSGETKTSQLFHFARWYHKNFPGRKIRLVTADGGGCAPFIDSGMVDSKVVDVYEIITEVKAYATIMKLSEGYWPKRFKKRGRVLEASEPFKEATMDGNGGLLMIEGLTSIAAMWERHLAHSESAGFKHSWKFEEDGYNVGGLQEGHFGMMQTELYTMINRGFNTLPFDYVLWTARVARGKNRQGDDEYGPKGAGIKQTTEYPSWFHDCIHLSTETVDSKLKKVAWWSNHNDATTGFRYPAKIRMLPDLVPQMYSKWPNGYMPLGYKEGKGLDQLYEYMAGITAEYRKGGETVDVTTEGESLTNE